MTAAFWFQIAIAGLLVVLALLEVATAWYSRWAVPAFSSAVSLVLAAWLVGAAGGLRRGSRVAHRLSLAGLVLPLVGVMVAGAFRLGTTTYVTVWTSSGRGDDVASWLDRLTWWSEVSSVANAGVSLIALVLAVSAAGMLLTKTSRRYFARAVN